MDTQALLDTVRDAYTTWGYPIVFMSAMLENTALLGLVLPGGALIMLGAVYAQQGTLEAPAVLLLAWVGMVAGTSLDYALGRLGIRSMLAGTRLGNRLSPKLHQAELHLSRHGAWAFLLAHFAGHVRSFLAITAGMSGLPFRRFLLYEGPAAFVWNVAFLVAGFLLGEHLDQLQRYMGAWAAALIVLLTAWVAYRLIRRRASPRPA